MASEIVPMTMGVLGARWRPGLDITMTGRYMDKAQCSGKTGLVRRGQAVVDDKAGRIVAEIRSNNHENAFAAVSGEQVTP